MKDKFKTFAKGVVIFLVALLVVFAVGEATGYNKAITRYAGVSPFPSGWTGLVGSHTFIAATDTAYFLFVPNQPADGASDTTVARVFTKLYSPNIADSTSCEWQVWSTADTAGWWAGATRTSQYNGLWHKWTSIARDSAATGIQESVFAIGNQQGGNLPYIAVVCIGKAAVSGGVANEIGNIAKVYIFEE